MNGDECKSPISTVTELLNSWQEGQIINVLKDYTEKWRYFGRIHDTHLMLECLFNFYDLGKLTYWNPSYFFKDVKWLMKTQSTAVGIRKW